MMYEKASVEEQSTGSGGWGATLYKKSARRKIPHDGIRL